MADNITITIEDHSEAIEAALGTLLPHQEAAIQLGKVAWKMVNSPAGPGKFAVARAGAEVLGINAFQRVDFALPHRRCPGYQSMDTIVSPAARGQGLFGRMVSAFYAQLDDEIVYGFPNANSAPGFFGKLGWNEVGLFPVMVRVLRTSLVTRRMRLGAIDFSLPLLGRGDPAAVTLTGIDADHAGRLWSAHHAAHGHPFAVVRDAAYLQWRLFAHPTADYHVIANDAAIVAVHIAQKHGTTTAYLMESIGAPKAVSALLHQAMQWALAQGATVMLALAAPQTASRRLLYRAGFVGIPKFANRTPIHWGYRPSRATPDALPPARWYLSYLDSDTV